MLPSTAGFIDPLFSTGIAHTLAGVERLASVFDGISNVGRNLPQVQSQLQQYAEMLQREFRLIDACVSAAYRTRHDFPRFVLATMLYFAGATTFERTRMSSAPGQGWLSPGSPGNPAFLCAHDDKFVTTIFAARQELLSASVGDSETVRVTSRCRKLLEPWNTVGLFDTSVNNFVSLHCCRLTEATTTKNEDGTGGRAGTGGLVPFY